MFDYPGRVYFTPQCAKLEDFYRFLCVLWGKSKNKDIVDDYTIFTVDTRKMKNVSFETDINYDIKIDNGTHVCGLYTTDNIHPDVIIDYFDVNIHTLMNILGMDEGEISKLMSYKNLLKTKK